MKSHNAWAKTMRKIFLIWAMINSDMKVALFTLTISLMNHFAFSLRHKLPMSTRFWRIVSLANLNLRKMLDSWWMSFGRIGIQMNGIGPMISFQIDLIRSMSYSKLPMADRGSHMHIFHLMLEAESALAMSLPKQSCQTWSRRLFRTLT